MRITVFETIFLSIVFFVLLCGFSIIFYFSTIPSVVEADYRYQHQISELKMKKYKCTGLCFCLDRKMSSPTTTAVLLKRSVFFLVASLTSVTAYKKAKEILKDDCISKLSDSCSLSSISSDIEKCEENNNINEEEEKKDEDSSTKIRYFCKGHCVKNGRLQIEYTKNRAEEFGCGNLKQVGEVEIEITSISRKGPYPYSWRNKKARLEFVKLFLTDFCTESSRETYTRTSNSGGKNIMSFSMCVGTSRFGRKNSILNPSVHCIQVNPKPKNTAAEKYWDQNKKKKIKKKTKNVSTKE